MEIGKHQSKESKYVCAQMAGQCALATPPKKAVESFNRKPYYMQAVKKKEEM